jgi:3-hydroxyisobutyrate dehydrogenase
MTAEQTVAVLGAGGTMGQPMARHIAHAGISVRAWNRSTDKASPLGEEGATVCESPEQAADGADVLLTMLADTDAVLDSASGALERLEADAIWLQMSTLGEAGTEKCAELARERGVAFIDAPVLGTKQPAEDGKLVVLASGPRDLEERVRPIFDAVGQKTMWVGEAGTGTKLKVVCNSWVLAVTEATAELIALAQALEIDPSLVFDAVEGGALDLPYLRMKGKAILEGNFEPMFRLKLAAKDAGLVEDSARSHGVKVPLFSVIREQMSRAAEEHGDEDMAATYFACAPAR